MARQTQQPFQIEHIVIETLDNARIEFGREALLESVNTFHMIAAGELSPKKPLGKVKIPNSDKPTEIYGSFVDARVEVLKNLLAYM